MSDPWFYERTADGWEIRDENRLLVAFVPDPEHERAGDAKRIARSVGVEQRPALPRNSTCVTSQVASSCAGPQLSPEKNMADRRELKPPPITAAHPEAVEVLRVWAVPDGPQQLTLKTQWDDPGSWGLLLVDIARHAAQAYARNGEGHDRALVGSRNSSTRSGRARRPRPRT